MTHSSLVKLKTLTEKDLELLLSWRSHPDAYKYFKAQNGPLTWKEHYHFWTHRKNREDFLVLFKENGYWRKVGSVNLSALNTSTPEIGIIIGELTAHHQGLGSKALKLALKQLKKKGFNQAKAVIHRDNIASQKLFIKQGFVPENNMSNKEWGSYLLETILK